MTRIFLIATIMMLTAQNSWAVDCVTHIPDANVSFQPDVGVTPADDRPAWVAPETVNLDLNVDPRLRNNRLNRDSTLPLGSVMVNTKTGRAELNTAESSQDLSAGCDR